MFGIGSPYDSSMSAFRAETRIKMQNVEFMVDMKIEQLRSEFANEISDLKRKTNVSTRDHILCQECFFIRTNGDTQYCVYPENLTVGSFFMYTKRPAQTINKDFNCAWYKKLDD